MLVGVYKDCFILYELNLFCVQKKLYKRKLSRLVLGPYAVCFTVYEIYYTYPMEVCYFQVRTAALHFVCLVTFLRPRTDTCNGTSNVTCNVMRIV
jgi:hypothetical protein